MEKTSKNPFRSSLWLIFFLLILVWILQTLKSNSVSYTYGQMTEDLAEGKIIAAQVTPDAAGSAGYVLVNTKSGISERIYVTDVSEAEAVLRENGIDVVVKDKSLSNYVTNVILPIVLLAFVIVFLL